jgi:hypothetical protein
MLTDAEIDRAIAVVTATLNDQKIDHFDRKRVQQVVTASLAGESRLTVDAGGGLHDENGLRIGAIRRTDSGEWITERQNATAEGSDAAIPGTR